MGTNGVIPWEAIQKSIDAYDRVDRVVEVKEAEMLDVKITRIYNNCGLASVIVRQEGDENNYGKYLRFVRFP